MPSGRFILIQKKLLNTRYRFSVQIDNLYPPHEKTLENPFQRYEISSAHILAGLKVKGADLRGLVALAEAQEAAAEEEEAALLHARANGALDSENARFGQASSPLLSRTQTVVLSCPGHRQSSFLVQNIDI